jgi:hypothetical protein
MRSAFLTIGLVAALAIPALAHEKGTIRILSKQVGVGGELIVQGEKLPKSAVLKMELRGTLETFPLAQVRTDSAGRFQARLALPLEVRAGTYTVVVVASDGDVTARADIVVSPAPLAGEGAMAGMEAHAGMPGTPGAPGPHATAEMMKVPVSTSGVEWAVIGGIIVLSTLGGAALLATSRRSRGLVGE